MLGETCPRGFICINHFHALLVLSGVIVIVYYINRNNYQRNTEGEREILTETKRQRNRETERKRQKQRGPTQREVYVNFDNRSIKVHIEIQSDIRRDIR